MPPRRACTSKNGSRVRLWLRQTGSRQQCIEEQPERRVRLTAVLNAESEQDDTAGADLGLDDRRLPGDRLASLDPAADQQIFHPVDRDRLRAIDRSVCGTERK